MASSMQRRHGTRRRVKKRYLFKEDEDTEFKQKLAMAPTRRVLSPKTVRYKGYSQTSAKVMKVRDLRAIMEDCSMQEIEAKPKVRVSDMHDPEEVARLLTYINGIKHLIRVRPRGYAFTIGRHSSCHFIIDDPFISNVHGQIYATETDTAEQLICYEDTSLHGTLWNSTRIKRQTIILSHGDKLTLASTVFSFEHKAQLKAADRTSQKKATEREEVSFNVLQYTVTPRVLGSGAFATVRLAIDKKTNRQVACKMMKKEFIEDLGFTRHVKQEIQILQELSHPNVAGFQGEANDSVYLYLFMDLRTGGDLFTYIYKKELLDGAESKYILYQLLLGLDYLHNELDLAHRDMKPENVLLRGLGPFPLVLISDFGSATIVQGKKSRDPMGTVYYWAPECFVKDYDAKALDCLATGCVLYIMLSGRQAFDNHNEDDSGKKQAPQHHRRKLLEADPSSADLRAKAVFKPEVDEMLDTQERIAAKKIISGSMHFSCFPSVDKHAIDLIRDMTASDPNSRYNVKDALGRRWITSTLADLKNKYEKDKQKIPARHSVAP